MKVVNQYEKGDQFPTMTLLESLDCSQALDELDARGVLFHQSLSDNMSLYEETCSSMSNYVSFSEYNSEDKLRVMFQEDLVSSLLIHGVVRSRKLVIPYGDYPSGGYHHYDMSIKEDRFVDRYANKLLKCSITTNFICESLSKSIFDYIETRLEARLKERSKRTHDIAVTAGYMVFDEDGSAHLEPVEWLCYLNDGDLTCEYMSHNGVLSPMDHHTVKNGLVRSLEHGFTVTIL